MFLQQNLIILLKYEKSSFLEKSQCDKVHVENRDSLFEKWDWNRILSSNILFLPSTLSKKFRLKMLQVETCALEESKCIFIYFKKYCIFFLRMSSLPNGLVPAWEKPIIAKLSKRRAER